MKSFNPITLVEEEAAAYSVSGSSHEMRLLQLSRKGVTKKFLLRLAEIGGFSMKELSELLPVSLRTIQRHSGDDLMDPAVSEHALQIAEVLSKASRIFKDTESMQRWFHSPAVALDNEAPVRFLDTSFGARMVTDMLGRIEHGVYS